LFSPASPQRLRFLRRFAPSASGSAATMLVLQDGIASEQHTSGRTAPAFARVSIGRRTRGISIMRVSIAFTSQPTAVPKGNVIGTGYTLTAPRHLEMSSVRKSGKIKK
jgi:hypothetical protein